MPRNCLEAAKNMTSIRHVLAYHAWTGVGGWSGRVSGVVGIVLGIIGMVLGIFGIVSEVYGEHVGREAVPAIAAASLQPPVCNATKLR